MGIDSGGEFAVWPLSFARAPLALLLVSDVTMGAESKINTTPPLISACAIILLLLVLLVLVLLLLSLLTPSGWPAGSWYCIV